MLSFARPEFLALAPFAVLLALWFARRRTAALRYPSLNLVRGLPRGRARIAIWGGAVLRGLALLCGTIAAAGPRTPDLRTRLPAEGIAIVLALDVSGSMATADFSGASRLDAAKQSFRLFVAGGETPDGKRFDGRPRDQIALVTFAAVPQTACPLTLNHTVLLSVTDEQKPKDGIDAGTNLGDALAEGVIRLEAAGPRRKVLILLSDGEHNVHRDGDGPLKPRQAAQLAANLGIPVYAIDCGGEPGPTADEIQQRADGRRVLDAVAAMTGGKSFHASNAEDLRAVYSEIDALERRPAESFRYRRFHEYGPWLAAGTIGLLTLVALLELTWWRRSIE